jgi:hypothetical protein
VYWACWVTWFIGSFANAIIFLNFLIAFISEIYTEVMATQTEEEYQKRAELLADRIEMDRIPKVSFLLQLIFTFRLGVVGEDKRKMVRLTGQG